MWNPGSSEPRRPNRLSASVVWLLVIGTLATIFAAVAPTTDESERHQVENESPRGQAASDGGSSLIWSLASSPDGTRVASAAVSGEVWIKNVVSGRRRLIQRGPMSSAQSVQFSADGRTLAVAGFDAPLRLYDAVTGAEGEPLRPEGENQAIRLAFSRDGKHVALVGVAGGLALWEWESRRKLTTLAGHRGCITDLMFSPDGSVLATCGSTGDVMLWSIPSGKALAALPHDQSRIMDTRLAFSSDGTLLATVCYPNGPVRLWTKAGKLVSELPTQGTGVRALAFSPDGEQLAIARKDGLATLWDISEGRVLGSFQANERSLRSLCFTRDGRILATGGADGAVRLWEVAQVEKRDAPRGGDSDP